MELCKNSARWLVQGLTAKVTVSDINQNFLHQTQGLLERDRTIMDLEKNWVLLGIFLGVYGLRMGGGALPSYLQ